MSDALVLNLKQQTADVLRKAKLWKWAVGIGVAALAAPIIWMAAYAMLGLAALGLVTLIIGTIGLSVINYAPVVATKMANHKIELLKKEARTKPIETLQRQYQQKMQALEAFKDKILKFATKVKLYDQQMVAFKQNFPAEASQFEETSQKMNALLKARQAKWQDGRDKLDLFWKEIEKFDAIWQMTMASADLRESAGDLDDTFHQTLQRSTAINAISEGLASSMAELDILMMEEIKIAQPASLTNSPSPVLDVQATVIDSGKTPSLATLIREQQKS